MTTAISNRRTNRGAQRCQQPTTGDSKTTKTATVEKTDTAKAETLSKADALQKAIQKEGIKSNQDLINHGYLHANGTLKNSASANQRAAAYLKKNYAVDMSKLTKNRKANVQSTVDAVRSHEKTTTRKDTQTPMMAAQKAAMTAAIQKAAKSGFAVNPKLKKALTDGNISKADRKDLGDEVAKTVEATDSAKTAIDESNALRKQSAAVDLARTTMVQQNQQPDATPADKTIVGKLDAFQKADRTHHLESINSKLRKESVAKNTEAPVDSNTNTTGAGKPATKPNAKFNPEVVANTLRAAMKGFGTDEKALLDAFKGKSSAEVKSIERAYEKSFGRTLDKDLVSELSHSELQKQFTAMGQPEKAAAARLRGAMHGFGTDEKAIFDVASEQGAAGKKIASAYQKLFHRSLRRDLKSELSKGEFAAAIEKLHLGAPVAKPSKEAPKPSAPIWV